MTGGAFTPKARGFLETVTNERLEKPFDMATLKNLVQDHLLTHPGGASKKELPRAGASTSQACAVCR
jgi:hypothetical protein